MARRNQEFRHTVSVSFFKEFFLQKTGYLYRTRRLTMESKIYNLFNTQSGRRNPDQVLYFRLFKLNSSKLSQR